MKRFRFSPYTRSPIHPYTISDSPQQPMLEEYHVEQLPEDRIPQPGS